MLKAHATFEEILRRDQHSVAKGTMVKSEGEGSRARFHVAEGWLAASKSLADGDQQIVEFILPGGSYDPTGVDGRTSFVQLEALCDAVIVPIEKTAWARLMRDHPELRDAERQRDIAAQARQSERMLRLGKSSAETRIAYVLIELCIRVSDPCSRCDGEFHVPLGRLADRGFRGGTDHGR